MRIVITGATGNVGSAVLRALRADGEHELVGLARRIPGPCDDPGVHWVQGDVADAPLTHIFAGADAVVNLAWEIQPSHRPAQLWRTNVLGTMRVADAVAAAGVPALVHASSVGVYAPGPGDERVSEDWPRTGAPTALYGLHKAEAERVLDRLERRDGAVRVVRLRPGLIFQARAAAAVGRLFLGTWVPRRPIRRTPLLALPAGLRLQAVHADDVARAYVAAVRRPVHGAVNIAAEPPLDAATIGEAMGARVVEVHPRVARALTSASWRMRAQPTSPGWLDMGMATPLMSLARARDELGLVPRVDARDALREIVAGLAEGAAGRTPALRPGRIPQRPRPARITEEEHE